MTKAIRIENADTSQNKAQVLVQQKNGLDDQGRQLWITVSIHELDYPTALATLYIHGGQRLVVEEKP